MHQEFDPRDLEPSLPHKEERAGRSKIAPIMIAAVALAGFGGVVTSIGGCPSGRAAPGGGLDGGGGAGASPARARPAKHKPVTSTQAARLIDLSWATRGVAPVSRSGAA